MPCAEHEVDPQAGRSVIDIFQYKLFTSSHDTHDDLVKIAGSSWMREALRCGDTWGRPGSQIESRAARYEKGYACYVSLRD